MFSIIQVHSLKNNFSDLGICSKEIYFLKSQIYSCYEKKSDKLVSVYLINRPNDNVKLVCILKVDFAVCYRVILKKVYLCFHIVFPHILLI